MSLKRTTAAGMLSGLLAAGPFLPTLAVAAPLAEAAADQGAAYFEFMRGRHLEGEGRVTDALAAYERAAKLDPASAEIRAEMAALYARQNRPDEALKAAKAALAIDADDAEAHWVIGTVYASLIESRDEERRPTARRPRGGAATGAPGATGGSSSSSATGAAPSSGGGAGASAGKSEEPTLALAIEHLEKARTGRRYDNGLHMTLGRLYLETENYPKAIEVLFYVVEREPGFVEPAFLLAQAYDGAGQRDRAVATLEDVVAAEPTFSRAWVSLADLYARDKQWDKSARAYDRAAADNPEATELRLRQAASLAAAGRATDARDILRKLAKDKPEEARVLYLLAETERSAKDYDAAEATAKQLIALAPKQPFGVHALSQVYAQRHQSKEIVALLSPAVKEAGTAANTRTYAPLWISLGQAYLELGQNQDAITAFERAKVAGGGEPSYDAYLVQAYIAAEQPKQALPLIASLRGRQPGNVRLINLEAQARRQAGDLAGAAKLLEEAASANPKDSTASVALAALYLDAKQYAKAEAVLTQAAAKFPSDITIPFQQGAVYEEQKRVPEAEQAFRRALSLDPKHAPTLNYLGYMLAERGTRLDEAVTLLTQAVQLEPFNGSYLDSLGWAYYKQGSFDKARQYLEKAGTQQPSNSVIQDHVGDVLFALRDVEGAVAAWKRALAGDGRSIDRPAIERKIDKALKK